MKDNSCYFLNKEEIEKVSAYVINPQKQAVNPDVVGKPASWIAAQAGVTVPKTPRSSSPVCPTSVRNIPSRESSPRTRLLCGQGQQGRL